MPHPTDKVTLELPTGRTVTWAAPTYSEGRRMLTLVADCARGIPGALLELMDLVETLAGGAAQLEDLVPIEIIDVASRFSLAHRHRPAALAPEPTGPIGSSAPPSS